MFIKIISGTSTKPFVYAIAIIVHLLNLEHSKRVHDRVFKVNMAISPTFLATAVSHGNQKWSISYILRFGAGYFQEGIKLWMTCK